MNRLGASALGGYDLRATVPGGVVRAHHSKESTLGGSVVSRRIGVVAIGRNEGERLRRCLASLADQVQALVYVDSGSTDGSVALAKEMGAIVVELDRGVPFTAARARNAGLARLLSEVPGLEMVQFVDGDCEVDRDWLYHAQKELFADPKLAVVCGRRRERTPEASVYNRLCDLEWDTPVGVADSCGGDALMRVEPIRAVDGYNPDLIAGEEPELCLRLRQHGWKIRRVDAEMTLHDAAMTRFRQWWKRAIRGGYAYADGAARHGHEPERHWVRDMRSIWFWGLGIPLCALGFAPVTGGTSLLLLGGYPALALRIYRTSRTRGLSATDARLYAGACVVGKFPQVMGQILYWTKRLTGRRGAIIEYKNPVPLPKTTPPS
jgi:glycosyltransferase involved in cell wall biosynthesis